MKNASTIRANEQKDSILESHRNRIHPESVHNIRHNSVDLRKKYQLSVCESLGMHVRYGNLSHGQLKWKRNDQN